VGLEEVLHRRDDRRIGAQVFGPAPAGQHQCVVVLGFDVGKARVEGEVVPRLLAVGLGALKVVDRGLDLLARLLVGAHGVHLVAYGQ
jgi:hypothetical protein